ncbi:hypothetical protein ScPMuIL_017669 [Solemya velum]
MYSAKGRGRISVNCKGFVESSDTDGDSSSATRTYITHPPGHVDDTTLAPSTVKKMTSKFYTTVLTNLPVTTRWSNVLTGSSTAVLPTTVITSEPNTETPTSSEVPANDVIPTDSHTTALITHVLAEVTTMKDSETSSVGNSAPEHIKTNFSNPPTIEKYFMWNGLRERKLRY